MSFNKLTTFKIEKTDLEVLDGDLVKTASVKLPDGHQYDPDYIYLKVKAVSAGEAWGCNKNYDYFPEKELKEWFKTFLTAHVFKNHENKKIEDSIGDVLSAEWVEDMKSVYLVIRIDKRIAPTIVRGFEKGFMTDVSMGCRVDHVICSYCGKTAKTRFDYCEHLKSMKGKVMDDGKKVYEINIGPKFHDISAVLNGAERTAKAEGIMIMGDKVAYTESTGMEKKASFEDCATEVIEASKYSNQRMSDIINTTVSIMEKVASDDTVKQSDVDVAKDTIKAKAMTDGVADFASSKLDSLEMIVDTLRNDYTEYMDQNACIRIGSTLREIADASYTPVEEVIRQFLKVADIAAIQLSPAEIHYILMEALDRDTLNMSKIPFTCSKEDVSNADRVMDEHSLAGGTGDCVKAISSILRSCDSRGYNSFSDSPVGKIKLVVQSVKPQNQMGDHLQSKIMDLIVSGMLKSRSNHRKFLIPRLEDIRSGSIKPKDNSNQYLPVKMLGLESGNEISLPIILSALLSASHENERVASFNDGSLHAGMVKFARYFDDTLTSTGSLSKTAGSVSDMKTTAKVIFNGIPVIYSYSALQRSRLNNGEQISSFNRFVGENPTNAAFLYSLAAPTAIAVGKAAKPLVKDALKTIAKVAFENNDIFTSSVIDDQLMKMGYNKGQIQNAKYASVLTELGQDDIADKVLECSHLDRGIIDHYLKTASACYKIDFEKQASNMDISNFEFHMGEPAESIYLKDAMIAASLLSELKM